VPENVTQICLRFTHTPLGTGSNVPANYDFFIYRPAFAIGSSPQPFTPPILAEDQLSMTALLTHTATADSDSGLFRVFYGFTAPLWQLKKITMAFEVVDQLEISANGELHIPPDGSVALGVEEGKIVAMDSSGEEIPLGTGHIIADSTGTPLSARHILQISGGDVALADDVPADSIPLTINTRGANRINGHGQASERVTAGHSEGRAFVVNRHKSTENSQKSKNR
jgi:hypothetical protein